jgi:RNA polymerase-binding transcription factor DksA
MPNRRLTEVEVQKANDLLAQIRNKINELASDDPELRFAYRRRLIVKLTHDERGTPAQRNKLKALKRIEQKGICLECGEALPDKYVELDRRHASLGYTIENTRLIHHNCHIADQAKKSYL